jgi:hypothetical protein
MFRPRFLAPLFALLLVVPIVAAAQEQASLSIDPPTLSIEPGSGPLEVRVLVSGVTQEPGLGGYALALTFDPAVLRAVSVVDSGLLEETGNPVTCPASATDNDAGQLALFCLAAPIFGENGVLAGEAELLATITFEPVAAGMTALDISESSISDPQGNALAATTSNGSVAVRPSPGPASEGTPSVGSGLPAAGAGGEVNTAPGLIVPLLLAIGGAVALGGALLLRRRRGAS